MLYKMYNGLVDLALKATSCQQGTKANKHSYKVPAIYFPFFPKTTREWNTLPLDVIESDSVSPFKVKLEKLILI